MKITLVLLVVFMNTICNAQPVVLSEQAGIKVSYEATKIEEDKKNDKWQITITIDNDAPQDIVYTGAVTYDQYSNKPIMPNYLKVETPNKKGIFNVGEQLFAGESAGFIAGDGSTIFRVPKGRKIQSFKTAFEKGEAPQVKASFLANIRTIDAVDVLKAGEEASSGAGRSFLIGQNGVLSQMREDAVLKYMNWENVPMMATWSGGRWNVSANSDFSNPQTAEVINVQAWDKGRLSVKVEGNGFIIYRNGDPSLGFTDLQVNYFGSDGYNQSAKLKPSINNKLMTGERLVSSERRTSRNGNYYLILQMDGNVVLYNRANQPLWATNTNGKPVANFTMQTDGNLVAYQSDNAPVWSSATSGSGNFLVVQDDGNVVVYRNDGFGVWATKTKGR
jgi:hypothetical protein